ncbi:MAG: 16S rRNA (cytidine(1402)-2'-O)-methyltransferase [Paludibacteraceae bacterium]|nr:16S rRNA (cytidine(1402)-2'-O)-methyltransferase [Paludibacteraceae bacterium]
MKLFVVPTPVGNLDDMTFRAIEVLKKVDFILAEDTRTSAVLLKHFDIKNTLIAHHKFNEHKGLQPIIERLLAGQTGAVISDAGTPGISDPGFLIVRACIEHNIPVECLPGATAFVPALVNAGLPMDRFCFEGFLPQKKGRQTRLQQLKFETRTIILYESPYRVVKTLTQLAEILGQNRKASVSREISKLYNETINGTLADIIAHFVQKQPKGEFVLVIAGANVKHAELDESSSEEDE